MTFILLQYYIQTGWAICGLPGACDTIWAIRTEHSSDPTCMTILGYNVQSPIYAPINI